MLLRYAAVGDTRLCAPPPPTARQSRGKAGQPVENPFLNNSIDLRGVERDLNRSLARVRVGVEWGVGHLKNWRILSSRYRADLARIDTDIHATVGLQKLNEQFTDRPLTYDRIKAA